MLVGGTRFVTLATSRPNLGGGGFEQGRGRRPDLTARPAAGRADRRRGSFAVRPGRTAKDRHGRARAPRRRPRLSRTTVSPVAVRTRPAAIATGRRSASVGTAAARPAEDGKRMVAWARCFTSPLCRRIRAFHGPSDHLFAERHGGGAGAAGREGRAELDVERPRAHAVPRALREPQVTGQVDGAAPGVVHLGEDHRLAVGRPLGRQRADGEVRRRRAAGADRESRAGCRHGSPR